MQKLEKLEHLTTILDKKISSNDLRMSLSFSKVIKIDHEKQ